MPRARRVAGPGGAVDREVVTGAHVPAEERLLGRHAVDLLLLPALAVASIPAGLILKHAVERERKTIVLNRMDPRSWTKRAQRRSLLPRTCQRVRCRNHAFGGNGSQGKSEGRSAKR